MVGKKKLAALVAPLAIAGSLLVMAGPVQATVGECASGYACNWTHASYGTFKTPFLNNISNYGTYGMHDTISSVYNNGNSSTVRFYKNENYGGDWFALSIKTGDGDLGNNVGNAPEGYNDSLDSGDFI